MEDYRVFVVERLWFPEILIVVMKAAFILSSLRTLQEAEAFIHEMPKVKVITIIGV